MRTRILSRSLKAGDIEALIEPLQDVSRGHPGITSMAGYFERNRERMRYRSFQECKLYYSSAVVEAGCKNVVGVRLKLKRGGMHWSVDGANKIAALRSCVVSHRFDDFWYAATVNQ